MSPLLAATRWQTTGADRQCGMPLDRLIEPKPFNLLPSDFRLVPTIFLKYHWCLLHNLHVLYCRLYFEFRIAYTVCVLTFNALHGHGPEYTTQMFATRDTPHGLRSRHALTLTVPRTKQKTLGPNFQVSVPNLWKELPKDLRNVDNVKVLTAS